MLKQNVIDVIQRVLVIIMSILILNILANNIEIEKQFVEYKKDTVSSMLYEEEREGLSFNYKYIHGNDTVYINKKLTK